VSGQLDTCLGRLSKPFIHFFLVGEQLLDAWALLHVLYYCYPALNSRSKRSVSQIRASVAPAARVFFFAVGVAVASIRLIVE
jgi:hypothetical protein